MSTFSTKKEPTYTDLHQTFNRQKISERTMGREFLPGVCAVRSHGRIIVVEEKNEKQRVLYDTLSKTAFLINVDYYGWVKSIALSIAGDILEDGHGINSFTVPALT